MSIIDGVFVTISKNRKINKELCIKKRGNSWDVIGIRDKKDYIVDSVDRNP